MKRFTTLFTLAVTLFLAASSASFAQQHQFSSAASLRLSPTTAQAASLQIYALDVGQGDSLLIISPTHKAVLIDAGVPGSSAVVMDAMRRNNIRSLDLMVATHAHADHIGAADEVLRQTTTQIVLDSGVPNTTRNYADFLTAVRNSKAADGTKTKYVQAADGQTFDIGGGAKLTVLAPTKPFFTKHDLRAGANEPNANSVVLRLDYNRFSMLFTGDAEAETEARLIERNANVRAQVLKVGHHGSRYATSSEFLQRVMPKDAIISDGRANNYGHPSPEALERLRAANVKFYRTDLQGEIRIETDGNTYRIMTAKKASEAALNRGRRPPPRQ